MVSCPFCCYFIVQVQNVSSPLHNLICGLVHISDIIGLPHHVSSKRPHMPMLDRAAQFQPFRALTGYEDAVHETARHTDEKVELTEDEKALLDVKLQRLAGLMSPPPAS